MDMVNLLEKYNLELSWKEGAESVYSNDVLLMKIIEEQEYCIFYIEYKDKFVKWVNASYSNKVLKEDKNGLYYLDKEIEIILKNGEIYGQK